MKEFKKHIHALTGVIIFLGFSLIIMILTGFTVKLPLPEEEVIVIDFGKSDSENSSNVLKEEKVLRSDENKISSENILVQDFENSEILEFGSSETDIELENAERINKLFGNPFGEDKNGNDKDSNTDNFLDGDDNSGPANSYGKLGLRKRVVIVEPRAEENLFGKVIFEITVDEKGNVSEIRLLSTNCNECVQSAKDAVSKWKYEALQGRGLQIGTVSIEFKQN